MSEGFRIFSLGDSALTVEFGNEISVDLNSRAIALADRLGSEPIPGFLEAVPAYASTTVYFDLAITRSSANVRQWILDSLLDLDISTQNLHLDSVSIPVDFGTDAGLDLAEVAEYAGMPTGEVIDIFTSVTYRVFMLGFLPGFTYMAEVDERIAMPRRETPRKAVPKGSVAIAGRQAGVYSLASPGGWRIIGRTDVEMFTPNGASPSRLKPGDRVRFVAK